MKKWKVTFRGRQLGAIGLCYTICTLVEAENEEEAMKKLYEKFQDIMFPLVEEIS